MYIGIFCICLSLYLHVAQAEVVSYFTAIIPTAGLELIIPIPAASDNPVVPAQAVPLTSTLSATSFSDQRTTALPLSTPIDSSSSDVATTSTAGDIPTSTNLSTAAPIITASNLPTSGALAPSSISTTLLPLPIPKITSSVPSTLVTSTLAASSTTTSSATVPTFSPIPGPLPASDAAAISVAVPIGVLLIALIALFFWQRRAKKHGAASDFHEGDKHLMSGAAGHSADESNIPPDALVPALLNARPAIAKARKPPVERHKRKYWLLPGRSGTASAGKEPVYPEVAYLYDPTQTPPMPPSAKPSVKGPLRRPASRSPPSSSSNSLLRSAVGPSNAPEAQRVYPELAYLYDPPTGKWRRRSASSSPPQRSDSPSFGGFSGGGAEGAEMSRSSSGGSDHIRFWDAAESSVPVTQTTTAQARPDHAQFDGLRMSPVEQPPMAGFHGVSPVDWASQSPGLGIRLRDSLELDSGEAGTQSWAAELDDEIRRLNGENGGMAARTERD